MAAPYLLPATLTLAQAMQAVQAIEQTLVESGATAGEIVLDAIDLHHFDTSAIAVLLEARRLAQAAGRTLTVRGAPAAMVELSRLYGVDALLGFVSPPGALPAHA